MGTATQNCNNTTNLQIAPSAVVTTHHHAHRADVLEVTTESNNGPASAVTSKKSSLSVDGVVAVANMAMNNASSVLAAAYARSGSIVSCSGNSTGPFAFNTGNASAPTANLNRPTKRGSMDSTVLNGMSGLTNSSIARRWTMVPPTKKEEHGKANLQECSTEVGLSSSEIDIAWGARAAGAFHPVDVDLEAAIGSLPKGGDVEMADSSLHGDDDSSSISSDSFEDYKSAHSKDEFWSEEECSNKTGGESLESVATWGIEQHFHKEEEADLPKLVSTESSQKMASTVAVSSGQGHKETIGQVPCDIWNQSYPCVDHKGVNGSPFPHNGMPATPTEQTTSYSFANVISSAFSSSLLNPPATSPPRQDVVARRNRKLLKSMQQIVMLNETALDFYRTGEYDAALDSLREAESQRGKLVETISRGRGIRSNVGVSNNLLNTPSWGAQLGSSCSETNLEQYTRSDSLGVGAPANAARTSYIYQRMDFDEGMHSFSNAESLHPSDFWLVGPDQIKAETNDLKWYEISPVVESTLVFNVGQVHRRRGEFDAAEKNYDRALEILRTVNIYSQVSSSVSGDVVMYPISIPILHNIGQLQYRRGDLPLAMGTYASALKHAQVIHGPRHVLSADALNCLGVLHYHTNSSEPEETEEGDGNKQNIRSSSTQRAMELFRQALSIRTDSLGTNHVDVATTLNNIGRIHVQRDEFDDALRYYEDALKIRRDRLGTNSLDYAATAFNAGQSLHQKGELDHAVELYHEFLRVALMKFGHSHRDVAVVLSGIAQIHQEKHEYDKALELYEESLCAGRAALGEYHSEIAMLLNRIGNFHFEREKLDEALQCYRRGLKIERRVLPPDHPNIVVTLSNLGEIHRQRSEWDDAAKMYSEALDILRKKHENKDHADIASTLNTIGLIHDQRGDTCLSLRFLQDALLMRRRMLGDDHLDVASTLVYVGTILYRKGVFSFAMELFSESLRIRQAALGSDHRDVAFALYNIALVHQQRGCYEEAIEFYSETLRVEKLVLGEQHRDVSMTLFKLGEVNKAAGDLDEALRCFQSSLAIERNLTSETGSQEEPERRELNGVSDPAAMARTLNEIGNIHLARGDVVPMMEAFNEASRLYRAAGLSPNNVVVSGHLYALEFSCPEAAPAA